MSPSRLQRSVLAVPATSERFLLSAARGSADAVFLDLEDAVAPARKPEARGLAIRALNEIDWGDKLVAVRINEIGSVWGYRDIIEVAETCPRLDTVLVPKVSGPEDIAFVHRLLAAIEASIGRQAGIGIEALIETPAGLAKVEEIAGASPRLESLAFGVGDYSVAMQVPQTSFGTPDPDYGILTDRQAFHWGDQWHFAMARIANACRGHGLRPIDGPFTDIDDLQGFAASARRGRALGFEGKWAIHPSQIETANTAYTPSIDEMAWAGRLHEAMSEAVAGGRGAARLDGRMIDLAHLKQAEILQSRRRLIDLKNEPDG
jgi:malyl-CoA/(S)-citramalyl-CoA lyase